MLAKTSSHHSAYKIRVGAVLVRHGKPISVGFNRTKTHRKSADHALTIHAEHSALIAANGANLQGATVFVYREDKQGKPRLARPCKNCMRLLREKGCKTMIYTTVEYPYFAIERL